MKKKFEEFNQGTRVLIVSSGDDYAALQFEEAHAGTKVIDIINNVSAYEPTDNDDGYWELTVEKLDCSDVPMEFIKFAKSQIDYDQSKHDMWYHEDETV